MTDYTAKLLDLEDGIITNVENNSDQIHISLELPGKQHDCPPAELSQTVFTITEPKPPRMFPLPETHSCICANTGTIAAAERDSLKRICSSPVTIVLPTGWLCGSFRNSKKSFPQAAIVADRYHVIRQVYWTMERVRKNEQNMLSDRFRKYFKQSRFPLTKPIDKLSDDEKNRLALMFEIAPRLADAYRMKNEFLQVIRSKSSVEGKEKLVDWLLSVDVMEIPEF